MVNRKGIAATVSLLATAWLGYYLTSYNADVAQQGATFPQASLTIENQVLSAKSVNQNVYDRMGGTPPLKELGPLPHSLSDIEHGVVLLTDADGNLVVNDAIKHLFEFYLSAIGEESLEHILNRIQLELSLQLQAPALAQAQSLLKRFVDYKIDLVSVQALPPESELSQIERIKHSKSQLSELRGQYFDSTEYESFFEREDIYDNYMLNHMAVVDDDSLSPSQKQQQLQLLEYTLPEEMVAVRAKVSKHAKLYESANTMRQAGAGDEKIFQMRAAVVGEYAAHSLAELDGDRRQWQQRLDDYAALRDRVNQSGLDGEDRQLAIDQLIGSHFSGAEKLRVKALDGAL